MPASGNRFAVLIFTDIVGSMELKNRHGVPAYGEALRIHNGHFERLAREGRSIRILQNTGDGYFAEAGGLVEAVAFALLFQDAMRDGPWGEVRLTARIGIHAGEVSEVDSEGGSGIVAPAADLASRVMGLAAGGQILLTRFLFDEARHFIREHPQAGTDSTLSLSWLAHGPYLIKGFDEPVEIFEVGAAGYAPLSPPPDGDKAKRAIRPGEEETLGWRPAVGLEIPGRPGWHLNKLLGAGGFGEVWAGEHAKLRQQRAFKFCFDDERLRALKREVTLVRLLRSALGERPDIVRLHEIKLDAPPFYLESDLAPHGNLLQWAEKQGGLDQIPLSRRIALVAHAATALAAAHGIGVLHKDIKPTNILIFDGPGGEPRPRLVDFGIGSLSEPSVLGQYGLTAAGFTRPTLRHSSGTPTYSPPEYQAGRPYTIQGDIYGLGVLLYQLVTAKPLDPLAPGWERDITDPFLREDIADCVDGDPSRRFASASDLAERLLHLDRRRLETEEMERLTREAAALAEAEAGANEARRRAARFRKLAAAFALLALVAVAGALLAWKNQNKADHALAEIKEKNAEIARRNSDYLAMLSEAARSDRHVAEEKLLAGSEREALAHLARACDYEPTSTLAAEKAVVALNLWYHLSPQATLGWHQSGVTKATVSPDGKHFATASGDNVARVWTGTADRNPLVFSSHDGIVEDVCFSPDGTRLATASRDKTVRIWNSADGGNPVTLTGHGGAVTCVDFSPDGAWLVSASDDRTAKVWNTATGKCAASLAGHTDRVNAARFSPDGKRVVTASRDGNCRVWDVASAKCLLVLSAENQEMSDAAFNPTGDLIVTASEDRTAKVWDSTEGNNLLVLRGHVAKVNSARFSPDGRCIVTASDDHSARTWDAGTGKPLAILTAHESEVMDARYSPDGNFIVTTSADKSALIWNPGHTGNLVTLAGTNIQLRGARFSPDSDRVLVASDDLARIWDIATGTSVCNFRGHHGRVNSARFNPDGKRVVTTSDDQTARVWDTATGACLVTLSGHDDEVNCASFSTDGNRIVTASWDKTVRTWDPITGECLASFEIQDGVPLDVQFSPDGGRLLIASNKTALLLDAATGRIIRTFEGHDGGVNSARFSPDGSHIMTASYDGTARIWDAATDRRPMILEGHSDELNWAEFSPDGSRVVTASTDNTARIWQVDTGRCVATLAGAGFSVQSASFSPDGGRIVTTSPNGPISVWNLLKPSAGPPPEWFADFLRHVARMRLDTNGERKNLKEAEDSKLRERLRAVMGTETQYQQLLRRFSGE